MDQEYASLVLAVMVVCLSRCLVGPRGWAALGLMLASAVWLPVNGGSYEGPVLLTAGRTHGLTVADLVGVGCIAIGAYTLIHLGRIGEAPPRYSAPRRVVAFAVVLVVLGFAVSYLIG